MRANLISKTWVWLLALAVASTWACVAPMRVQAATQETRLQGREVRRVEVADAERMAAEGKLPFSEKELEDFEEREAQAEQLEDYQGGVAIVIGGGVLLVALLVVLIIVLVD